MKGFDSAYIGNKTDWRKQTNVFNAFFTGKLLPSDYRIVLAFFAYLYLFYDYIAKCSVNYHHKKETIFHFGLIALAKDDF